MLFKNLKNSLIQKLENIFSKKDIDYADTLNDILIEADVEEDIINFILNKLKKKQIKNIQELKKEIFFILKDILINSEKELIIEKDLSPFTIILVGVNGAGKTTTVAKLANFFKKQNKTILVAAGDTYRAAGIEQLDYICKKHDIPIIKQHTNADSASVIFDAFNIAKNKNIDILIADTSGRLNTNERLMNDLKKIDLSLKKINITAPNETFMIIDSNFGRNSINQVTTFNKYIKITGVILTKTDNTAKGGILISLAKRNIPIRYICNGEHINDIHAFKSEDFLKVLLNM